MSWLIEDRISKENIEKLLRINGTQICPRASLVSKEDIEIANKSTGFYDKFERFNNEDIEELKKQINIANWIL